MQKYFDDKKWAEAISYKDWYLLLDNELKRLMDKAEKSAKEISKEVKEEIYSFFERNLKKGKVALCQNGPNWDQERKPIDTIVIHHTAEPTGITWQRLNAMHLVRLYVPYYTSPQKEDKNIKGQPIFSNHFRNGQQVFYAYHWLIRKDGKPESLLNDNEIGWQSGNWEVNCKSISICLDGDFENSSPPNLFIQSATKLIKEKYPNVKPENIIGHREVKREVDSRTITCPGNKFLTDWKLKLTDKLK